MTRVTKILIHGKTYTLQVEYKKIDERQVEYSVFRSRLKTYERKLQQSSVIYHDKSIFSKAGNYSQKKWMKIIGIGRARTFTYRGSKFKKYAGLTFISMPFFLGVVGKLNNHKLVQSRLKQGFDIDRAIVIPKCSVVDGFGQVYLLTNLVTKMRYVGLTTIGIKQRFEQHVTSSNHGEKMSKLHSDLKEFGRENFKVTVLANKVPSEILGELEIKHIREYRTLWPNGLNSTPGGELRQRQGNKCNIGNKPFKSVSEASRFIKEASAGRIKRYVAEIRIRQGLPIPQNPRKHSKHIDAGSWFWRRHLAMKRKHLLYRRWTDFDYFQRGIEELGYNLEMIREKQLILFRPDKTKKYMPDNCLFISRSEERARCSGNVYIIKQEVFYGLASVARAYKISESTLRNRAKSMNLSIEDAIKV
jgi:hypothetical protein